MSYLIWNRAPQPLLVMLLAQSVFAVQPVVPNNALSPQTPSLRDRWNGVTGLWASMWRPKLDEWEQSAPAAVKAEGRMELAMAVGGECYTNYTWACLTKSIRPWGPSSTPFSQWSSDLGCCLQHWSKELKHDNRAYWHNHGMMADRLGAHNNPYNDPTNVVLGMFSFHFMADAILGLVPDEDQTKLFQSQPFPVYTDNRTGFNFVGHVDMVKPLMSNSSMTRTLSRRRSVTGPSDPPLIVVADDANVANAGVDFGGIVQSLTDKTGRDAVALWIDDHQPYDSVRDAALFKNPRVRQLLVTNTDERREKVSSLPIGVSNPALWTSILKDADGLETRVEQRTTLLQCCCLTTHGTPGQLARKDKLAALRANGFECDASLRLQAPEYANRNVHSKFVFSPSGNGRKNHREFEAWMTGAVPVLDFDPNDDPKLYTAMPAVVVSNWSSVTPAFLEGEWARIQREAQQGAYDMRQAYLPYWYARMHESR